MVAGLARAPTPCGAAEEIALAWDDCAGAPLGLADKVHECSFNTGFEPLFPSFQMPQATGPDVIGLELVLDLQHSDAALPDWWRFSVGGCREDLLRADTDFSTAPGCADPWAGLATAQVQAYVTSLPFGQPNQARILVTVGVPSLDARALDATTRYHAVRIRLQNEKSSGAFACLGCNSGACLVLNSIAVRRLPGSPGGDVVLTAPLEGNGNRATWQGGQGADCTAVPVRRRTWGALKGLYR